jgi:hypothetical protein
VVRRWDRKRCRHNNYRRRSSGKEESSGVTEFHDLLSQMLDERGMSRDELIEQLVAGFPEGPLASPGYGYSREHVYRAIEGAEELEAWLVGAIAQVLELDREKMRDLAEAYRNDLCAEVEAEPRQR